MRRFVIVLVLLAVAGIVVWQFSKTPQMVPAPTAQNDTPGSLVPAHELSIPYLRDYNITGSELTIEETLEPGTTYSRYVASYESDGNKIYGLLTVPNGQAPASGWPLILFNHGYIPPAEYQTTERYVAYQDRFARNGYITFKSDYRGHGRSEGTPAGGYGSNGYTIDVLNALATLERYTRGVAPPVDNLFVDPSRIGMWGHSMGGFITLRAMVVRPDIKAGVVWGGVVASYPDLINNWRRRISSSQPIPSRARRWRDTLVAQYGEPNNADPFWRSLSANNYLGEISGPIQLHHGTADESVPVEFSQNLEKQLKEAGKTVEYYEYSEDDHDITSNFNIAIQRSLDFFDIHVKNSR